MGRGVKSHRESWSEEMNGRIWPQLIVKVIVKRIVKLSLCGEGGAEPPGVLIGACEREDRALTDSQTDSQSASQTDSQSDSQSESV